MSDSDEVGELARQILDLSRDPSCRETTFVVDHAGWVIEVNYTCGSSAGLTLRAPYDHPARTASPERALGGYRGAVRPLMAARPLDIELRPEGRGDVAAKQQGLSVEWQSGDAAFDAAIYVSTPTTDAAVLAAVLCERSGVGCWCCGSWASTRFTSTTARGTCVWSFRSSRAERHDPTEAASRSVRSRRSSRAFRR
jgi:hypothetical protein